MRIIKSFSAGNPSAAQHPYMYSLMHPYFFFPHLALPRKVVGEKSGELFSRILTKRHAGRIARSFYPSPQFADYVVETVKTTAYKAQ